MSALKGRVAPAAFQAAAQTLLAYVRNLVAHPEDPRYRRIKVRLLPAVSGWRLNAC